jgi:hypothetical protein
MEVALRECIATALWKANRDLRFRVDRVRLIQKVLDELFRKGPDPLKRDSDGPWETVLLPTAPTSN